MEHLLAELLSLEIVLPEEALVLLQAAAVKVVLLPVPQRPVPVCQNAGIRHGRQAGLL
jgi:hypothetical protein